MSDLNKSKDDIYGKRNQSVPKPEKQIGIDTHDTIYDNIMSGIKNSSINLSELENFSTISQNREQVYELFDTMAEDSRISAILETYAEDATTINEQGRVVWAESADSNIATYVTFLLDSMNVDKHSYAWVYSLCKYGDLYLKLFRESDFEDGLFNKEEQAKNRHLNEALDKRDPLTEDINIKAYAPNDKLATYVERVPNPAEIFELTRFGKTYAYIEAPTYAMSSNNSNVGAASLTNNIYTYQFNKSDVNIYNAMSYVHAALEDNTSRTPEKVEIFRENGSTADGSTNASVTYTVRRGTSILNDAYKIWRIMSLLENALILNRLTKSSITRILNVEVGDMPKEQVAILLNRIKSMIEQKTALNKDTSMTEYTNPSASENIIYMPIHNQQGAISAVDIGGGNPNEGQLYDIDYFKNKLYGSLKAPKQYFGDTDDAAGFNGGQSLALISARYSRTVVRIQNTFIQALTDAINLMLLNRGLTNYVNKFTLKMVAPTSQEAIDKIDYKSKKVGLIRDLVGLFQFEDPATSIKLTKALLSDIIEDPDALAILDNEIERLDEVAAKIAKAQKEQEKAAAAMLETNESPSNDLSPDLNSSIDAMAADLGGEDFSNNLETPAETIETAKLPSAADLGISDLTDTSALGL